ncbi:MAG: hypothetical protein KF823_03640 [Xanthomonadales bacterium]|nr:hypothetical protein [Xanthomonadales bacterium]
MAMKRSPVFSSRFISTLCVGVLLPTLALCESAQPPRAGLSVPAPSEAALTDELWDQLIALDNGLSDQDIADLLGGLLPQAIEDALVQGGPSATGYSPHRRWRRGNVAAGFGIDQFNQPDAGVYRARAATRMPGGEILVVGESTSTNNVTHVALVRYDRYGRRVAWPHVQTNYSLASGEAARFPGNDTASGWGVTRFIHSVQDVLIQGSFIYVLATQLQNGQRRPIIIRFSLGGSHYSWSSSNPDSETIRDAVAMDSNGQQLIVLGRRSTSATSENGGFWVTRWDINANGSLSQGSVTTFLPGRRIPADIRFRRQSAVFLDSSYYVAYTFNTGSSTTSGRYPCLLRVNASDQADAGFAPSGIVCSMVWDGGNNVDRAVALHNRAVGVGSNTSEHLFLSVDVDRDLANGIGVLKLVDGVFDSSFGPLGRRVYGGCAGFTPQLFPVGEGCGALPASTHTLHIAAGRGLHVDSSGVYVTGYLLRNPSSGPTIRRPIFMHVDANDGSLNSLQSIGVFPGSQFTALVPRPGGSEFTLAGWASDEDSNGDTGPKRFLTSHIVRNSDLIFYDGLQSAPDL